MWVWKHGHTAAKKYILINTVHRKFNILMSLCSNRTLWMKKVIMTRGVTFIWFTWWGFTFLPGVDFYFFKCDKPFILWKCGKVQIKVQIKFKGRNLCLRRTKKQYSRENCMTRSFTICNSPQLFMWSHSCAHMGKRRNSHRVLAGKPEGKKTLERPRHKDGRIILKRILNI